MTLYTLERLVPPLNINMRARCLSWNRQPKVRVTQKSFSITAGVVERRLAVSVNSSRLSLSLSLATLFTMGCPGRSV